MWPEWERPDWTWRKYFRYDSEDKNETYKRKTIPEVNDYVRIDDFYSRLADRYLDMKPNPAIDDFRLAELNRQCLELAENALTKTYPRIENYVGMLRLACAWITYRRGGLFT